MSKKFVNTTASLLDPEGRPVAYYRKNTVVETSDRFSYLYENEWTDWIKKTNSVATLKVFFALCCHLVPGRSILDLTPKEKKQIAIEYGISDVSYYKALNELEELGVILRGDIVDVESGVVVLSLGRGEMMMNPSVAWKGTVSDRKNKIEDFLFYYNCRNKQNEKK